MSKYSIENFLRETAQDDNAREFFELENPYLLETNLNGKIWAKLGSMIGYTGDIKFTRQGVMEGGIGKMFKKALTGETNPLMSAEGNGRVYFADSGKKVRILSLQDEMLFVNGNNVLAFSDAIKWDIKMMKRVAGIAAGGLFNMQIQGTGPIAITTHFDPITLAVTPEQPVYTDPNATIAWSSTLQPEIKTDISFKTFLGRGSGESFQLAFKGQGWVVLQPYEEVYYAQTAS
ncbi:MAG: AIM24 family protein [Pyrinomonadaceae bacterium]|nr:AIM24 family protein [Pyrinomonadaceae bacterium]